MATRSKPMTIADIKAGDTLLLPRDSVCQVRVASIRSPDVFSSFSDALVFELEIVKGPFKGGRATVLFDKSKTADLVGRRSTFKTWLSNLFSSSKNSKKKTNA